MYLNTFTPGRLKATFAKGKSPAVRLYKFFVASLLGLLLAGAVPAWAARTVPESDSLALVDFYNSTGGPSWTNKTNWLTGTVNTWSGITVTNGRVARIYMQGNNLVGSLPASLEKLDALLRLSLTFNQLSGSIPPEMGNMTSLQYLFLGDNNLTGSIPASLGNLTALTDLGLQANQLSGTIPKELANLTQLVYLALFDNQLTGNIPVELIKLTKLRDLLLDINKLSGSVPGFLGEMAALKILGLSKNQFSGNIPVGLSKSATLGSLYLDNNQLTGSIPGDLAKIPTLSSLVLSYNQLSGSIPTELGSLTTLNYFRVNNNQLSGSVPASMGGMAKLIEADLAHNQFTSLPTFTGNLNGRLYVNHNRLTFESLEPNISKFINPDKYIPQDSVGTAQTIVLAVGQSVLLSALVGGANNRYQWTNNGVPIPGANQSTLTVNTAGAYSCQITNTIVPELVLFRRTVHVSGGGGIDSGTVPTSDSLALVALYNSTNGAGWANKTNWLTDPVNTWHGVTVKESRVNALVLSSNQLKGSLPVELGNLTALQELFMSSNQLTGNLPASLGNLTDLKFIFLSDNQLSGSVPATWGNLTHLYALYMDYNQLSGSLPTSFSQLRALEYVNLSHNQLSGSVPASESFGGGFNGLYKLNLSYNQFTSLPNFLGGYPEGFYVDHNRLTFESFEANYHWLYKGFGSPPSTLFPQDSVKTAASLVLTPGQSVELSALVGGANNRYQWTKNGVNISGATQASLTVSEAGTYGCKITNNPVWGKSVVSSASNSEC
jgi:Leucine-rich repeat (LRR) protein